MAPTEALHSDSTWRAHVIDRLRSLTRALAVVAVLAVAALGIALWALLAEDDDDGRTRARAVRALEDRVERLEAQVDRAPSRVVVSVRDEQRSLDERLDELEQDTSEAIDGLRQDVRELEDRVDELRQQLERPTAPEQ
jgi:DNA repair exonuclease SbcCD ATPase subunit